MDVLERTIGGPQEQADYQDFVDRFQRGAPYDSIDENEAIDRYQRLTPSLSPSQYQDSARVAFDKLSPAERTELSRWLRTRAKERGVAVPDYDLNDDGIDDRMQDDPDGLAGMTTEVRQKDPSIFEQLLGKGGTGGPLDNPIAKITLAGIAAMAAKQLLGRR